MSQTIEIKVPDIGDYQNVPVIDILVAPGDSITTDQSLITLESDKATIDIPSPCAGTLQKITVKSGDTVSEGSVIAVLELLQADAPAPVEGQAAKESSTQQTEASSASSAVPAPEKAHAVPEAPTAASEQQASSPSMGQSNQAVEVKVPDIGDYQNVPVVDVLVAVGDQVAADQSLVTLESDKATIDIPSPFAGIVQKITVKSGDTVSEGSVIVILETAQTPAQPSKEATLSSGVGTTSVLTQTVSNAASSSAQPPTSTQTSTQTSASAVISGTTIAKHASPSIRKFARELGVEIDRVVGTGPKGRVQREDVIAYNRQMLSNMQSKGTAGNTEGLTVLPWPEVDFSKWGAVEAKPLSRIKKLSGANLHRNWVMIPHVTNQEDADITELEDFRLQLNREHQKTGQKATLLAFLLKACVAALKAFPEFNASLDGENLVYKQYYHLGFAADTPNGLMVPVIKNADQKGVMQLAQETAELAGLARAGKLKPEQMQGGCFSISSLGGIGGTGFTPIINAPEVAILGVSRGVMRAVWNAEQQQFTPRLIVPLSLSYDHRVIDGAQAARFNAYLAQLLADFRRVLL